jgi:hypothetical protein
VSPDRKSQDVDTNARGAYLDHMPWAVVAGGDVVDLDEVAKA